MSSSCVVERQDECSSARHLLGAFSWIQVDVAEGEETSSSGQRYEEEYRSVCTAAENSQGADVSVTGTNTSTRSSRGGVAQQTTAEHSLSECQYAARFSEPRNPDTATDVEVDGHTFIVYQQLRSSRTRNLFIALGVALFVVLGMVILPAVLFGVVIVKKPT